MDRIDEIQARYTPGDTQFRDVGKCTITDIGYLLGEVKQLRAENENLKEYEGLYQDICDKHQVAHEKMVQAYNLQVARAEKAEANTKPLMREYLKLCHHTPDCPFLRSMAPSEGCYCELQKLLEGE